MGNGRRHGGGASALSALAVSESAALMLPVFAGCHSLDLRSLQRPALTQEPRWCVSRLDQFQPRQTASLCCIRDQPRQFRTLLRDFRRPCPCCTRRLHPSIEPPLGPPHQFWRSKKLLPRHHFHDPPPDGPIRRIALRPPIAALSWLSQHW